jgi:hypothetical protein
MLLTFNAEPEGEDHSDESTERHKLEDGACPEEDSTEDRQVGSDVEPAAFAIFELGNVSLDLLHNLFSEDKVTTKAWQIGIAKKQEKGGNRERKQTIRKQSNDATQNHKLHTENTQKNIFRRTSQNFYDSALAASKNNSNQQIILIGLRE